MVLFSSSFFHIHKYSKTYLTISSFYHTNFIDLRLSAILQCVYGEVNFRNTTGVNSLIHNVSQILKVPKKKMIKTGAFMKLSAFQVKTAADIRS